VLQSQAGHDRTLSEAIIVMARKLGLKVIAEGVEDADQRDFLINARCDLAQGFLCQTFAGSPVRIDVIGKIENAKRIRKSKSRPETKSHSSGTPQKRLRAFAA
jgi:EAL domain-containing protein (putative c-di-GMP-specific phosphodiesterase class I)